MSKNLLLGLFASIICCVSAASAHYLWVNVDAKSGDHGAANIYFEEGPGPGDGHYLDPIMASGKTWIRTVAKPEPIAVTTKEVNQEKQKKRWITAPLDAAAPRSIDTYAKFGVYPYGKTDVLLHYYAKYLDLNAHEDLHELGRAEQLDLDIVPHDFGNQLTLTLLWKGKPAADRTFYVRGPKRRRQNLKTDADGKVKLKVEAPGMYTFRSNVEEDKQGTDAGKEYVLIRHHATLVMTLPLDK